MLCSKSTDYRNSASKKPKSRRATRGGSLSAEAKSASACAQTGHVKRQQAFKFELKPKAEQLLLLRRFAGCCRFVYNRALALQQANYKNGGKFIRYESMAKELTAWRHNSETLWLADAPVHPLQHALKNLERAYENFFEGRSEFPQFKKRGDHDSFRCPDQTELDQKNSRIRLPKSGWM
jgi:putative transposase